MARADWALAWRSIRGMPVAAAVIVASLAVGIGVNTVVFTWIQALVLNPLPGVPGAAAIHVAEPQLETGARPGMSWPEYEDIRDRLASVAPLAAFRMVPLTVGRPGRTERAYGLLVSDNYFSVLRLRPSVGRLPQGDEWSRARAGDAAVVSHDYWMTHLGGDPASVGQPIVVNGRPLTIIAVAPEGFQGTVLGVQFDFWLPAARAPGLLGGSTELDSRNVRGYSALARLSGPALAQASAVVNRTMAELVVRFPETNEGITAQLLPFWRAFRGPQRMLLQGVALLQAVLLLLLLAVCSNTANLLLARAAGRRTEVGVRLSIGAGPWRIARMLLVENLLLALLAAALGVVLAAWGTDTMRAVPVLTTAVPVKFVTGLDPMTLAFAVALAVLSALACGVPPAWHLSRLDPVAALQSPGSFAPHGKLRRALMAAEVALALVVLLAAGLFYRSFTDTRVAETGFRPEGVLLAAYDLGGRGRDAEEARQFVIRLLDGVRSIPGVESAAVATSVPLDIHGLPQRSFTLEGRARPDDRADRALSNIVTPGYFDTMGVPFVEGVDLPPLDDTAAPRAVVVNQAFAARYIPDGAALGRQLESGERRYTIVGVVKTTLSDAFGEPALPVIYFSYRDRTALQGEVHARTRAGAEATLAGPIRRVVNEIDPSLPVYNVRTLGEHIETNLFLRRIPARLFSVLGPLLLLLAAGGVYAVTSYAVASRTREVGVRLALGATPGRVVGQIVRDSLRVIAAGAALGWLAVYVVYIHLSPGSPVSLAVFAGIPATLVGIAVAACWVPARRAGRIDPADALRVS